MCCNYCCLSVRYLDCFVSFFYVAMTTDAIISISGPKSFLSFRLLTYNKFFQMELLDRET